jgi:hypothetical protein
MSTMSVSSVTASPPPPPPPPAQPPVEAKVDETKLNASQAKDDADQRSASQNDSSQAPKAPLPPGQGTRVDIIA